MDRILFVSDLHCGSHYGVFPQDRVPPTMPHVASRYLTECWHEMVEEDPGGDLLVLNGDLIDGRQRKSDGTKIYTSRLDEQTEGAIELLEPLAKKFERVVRTDGTAYHEDFHGALRLLDEVLNVEVAKQILNIQLPGGVLNVAHHPPGGSVLYQGTKMDRQILWNLIQSTNLKIPQARWIARAHLHEWARLDRKGLTVFQMPCWKLSDPYAKKLDYERFQPDIGTVAMVADPEEDGGYAIRPRLWPLPQAELEVLNLA